MCDLVWNMLIQDSQTGEWELASEVIADATDSGSANGLAPQLVLSHQDYSDIDPDFLHTDGCDQYLVLDWQIFSQSTLDEDQYSAYTRDASISTRVVFKETIC